MVRREARPLDLLEACKIMAECSVQYEHEPLKGAMRGVVTTLLAHIESQCRASVQYLLQGLGSTCEGRDLQFEKLWSLHKLGRRSYVAKEWILELGGPAVIASALAAYPDFDELREEGMWLIHDISGVTGVAEMINHGSPAVQAAAVWVVSDRAKIHCDLERESGNEWHEAVDLVAFLHTVLARPQSGQTTVEVLRGCCTALRSLISAQPIRGTLFLQRSGCETLVNTLRTAHASGQNGQELLAATARLVAVIAEGNLQATRQLCQHGILEALVGEGLGALHSTAAQDVMWVIGQLSGALSVVQAIVKVASPPLSSHSVLAVHGGLAVLAEIVWQPSDEACETFPHIAPTLLNVAQAYRGKSGAEGTFALALKSLGGVLCSLSARAGPGRWNVVDEGVNLLAESVGHVDTSVVQEAVESLGRIAMAAPAWQGHLKNLMGALSNRLRVPATEWRLKKYLFWATAAIAGIPAVVLEMQAQQSCPKVQDAAICSIIDLLDDNLDGEFSLTSTAASAAHARDHVLDAMTVVLEAMRLHVSFLPVQYRGCHALGLLQGLMQSGVEVPDKVLDTVLGALWRHPLDFRVVRGVCFSLRAFLEPRRGVGGAEPDGSTVGRTVVMLRAKGASPGVQQIVEHFSKPPREGETVDEELFDTLEDALYVLTHLDGVSETVQVLVSSGPDAELLRASGLKALFELGRFFPELFVGPVADEVAAAAEILQTDNRNAGINVTTQRHAELLKGLVWSASQPRFPRVCS
mmetsp:Transcript_44106/g.116679  ORF Transcript_44106/g.116679 Transcript_44106/m.116679 type:complete len:752 (-) Transcript_44106:97-2352(-)